MSELLRQNPVPLRADEDGILRIAGTRVPLETLISAFELGATPEELVQDFPVLPLDAVYAVITYYLQHRDEVEGYLATRRAVATEVRQRLGARFPTANLRERLLARQTR